VRQPQTFPETTAIATTIVDEPLPLLFVLRQGWDISERKGGRVKSGVVALFVPSVFF